MFSMENLSSLEYSRSNLLEDDSTYTEKTVSRDTEINIENVYSVLCFAKGGH